jgi:hypothetical protein
MLKGSQIREHEEPQERVHAYVDEGTTWHRMMQAGHAPGVRSSEREKKR